MYKRGRLKAGLLRRAGRWAEALDAMQHAAVLDPNSVENLLTDAADTLRILDRFREAAAWQEAMEIRAFREALDRATATGLADGWQRPAIQQAIDHACSRDRSVRIDGLE